MRILIDTIRVCNSEADPELLIIHCPRIIQVSPWCDWAASTAEWLEAKGWIRRRELDAVHLIHPMHPAVIQ